MAEAAGDAAESSERLPAGPEAQAAKKRHAFDESHRYIQLSDSFWTRGWAVVLSGPGIAMLIVMLTLTENGKLSSRWISPSRARAQYGLSEDTWSRGIGELRRYGVSRRREEANRRRLRLAARSQHLLAEFERDPGDHEDQ